MPLSRLFRLLTAVLAIATAGLVVQLASTGWQDYQRAGMGQLAVDQLRLALRAAEMVLRERGPTSGALGGDSPPKTDVAHALNDARVLTDRAFGTLGQVLSVQLNQPSRRDAAVGLETAWRALREARAMVDQVAALPKTDRDSEAIRSCVTK